MLFIQQKLKAIFDYFQLPQRFIFCYFNLLAIVNASIMRLCLDFSLNRIVMDCMAAPMKTTAGGAKATKKTTTNRELKSNSALKKQQSRPQQRTQQRKQQPTRRPQKRTTTTAKPSEQSFSSDWTPEQITLVSIAFYGGYMLTHIPGGRLAERYGGKWVLAVNILFAAILTLLTPMAVRAGGPVALIAMRLLLGLCMGPTFPAVSAMLAQWVPANERGTLGSFVLSGGEIGITLMQLVSELISQQKEDWPNAFYLAGSSSMLWFLGYILICSSKPDTCPFINNEEREYIKNELVKANPTNVAPWRSMLLSTPLWALVSATVQYNWNQLINSNELRNKMDEQKGHSLWQASCISLTLGAPHLLNWFASLCTGTLSDYLVAKGILTRTGTRRLMSFAAISVFVSISMYLTYAEAPWNGFWSVLGTGTYYAGIKLLPLDMSPSFAGTLMGIANGLGALPGLLLPYLQELECNNLVVGTIRTGLWIISATYMSGDEQSYNLLPEQQ